MLYFSNMGKNANKTTEQPTALGVEGIKLFDITCGHCKRNHKILQDGQFHCKYCGVMCENCASEHQKTPKTKGHWAQKLKRIHQEVISPTPTFNHLMKCELHQNRTIKGYCLDHGQLCCKNCMKSPHGLCALEELGTMSEGVSRDSHMLDAKHELSDLKRRCKKVGNIKREEIINMAKQGKAFEEYLKEIRDKIITLLDDMITAILSEKEAFCKAEAEIIEQNISECVKVGNVLESAEKNLDVAFRGGKQVEMWVALKKLEHVMTHYDERIALIEKDKDVVKFEFLPNKSLQGLLQAPESVGKLKIVSSRIKGKTEHDTTEETINQGKGIQPMKVGETNPGPWSTLQHFNRSTPSLPPVSRSGSSKERQRVAQSPAGRKTSKELLMTRSKNGLLTPVNHPPKSKYKVIDDTGKVNGGVFGPVEAVRLTYIGRKEIMTAEDHQPTSVTGSTFLPNGRLVLVDNHNKTLKLYSAEYEFLAGLILQERPWNVTSCYKTVVAVSYPYDLSVDLIVTGLEMKFQRKIKTDRPCHGMGYHHIEKWLYVACGEGKQAQIQAYSLEGQLKKVIIPKEGVLHEPCYMVMSSDSKKMFISDLDNGIIGFNTKTGEVICHYKDRKISRYWDLKLDSSGKIFVLTTGPDCLYVLMGEHNGQLVKEFSTGTKPCSLSYSAFNHDLVITRWTAEDINVFRFV